MTFDSVMEKLKEAFDYITLPRFANRQRGLRISRPRRIVNHDCIYLGDSVFIGPNSVLAARKQLKNEGTMEIERSIIRLGDRVQATSGLHIHCVREVTIASDVLIGPNVLIADHTHGYANTDIPFRDQPIQNIAPIRIDTGSWIGQNVAIMPGVTIGKFCIVGAGSIVTKSIPDYTISVGSPARIIKRWSVESRAWMRATS